MGNACGIGFCMSFAISFVLMSQIVKEDGPVVSTLLTYGLSQLIFLLIRWRHVAQIKRASLNNIRLFSWVNILTCANTILVYIILTNLTAFTYVIVFFGTLSASTYLVSLSTGGTAKSSARELLIGFIALCVGAGSIWYGGNSLVSDFWMSLFGLALTVLASLAGAAYLVVSQRFQRASGLATSDIVGARFTLTVIVCSVSLIASNETVTITYDTLSVYLIIALLGSVVPLFLLQKSNELNGPEGTSRFMPTIPIMCGVFSLIFVPGLLTWIDGLLALAVFLAMASRLWSKRKVSEQEVVAET